MRRFNNGKISMKVASAVLAASMVVSQAPVSVKATDYCPSCQGVMSNETGVGMSKSKNQESIEGATYDISGVDVGDIIEVGDKLKINSETLGNFTGAYFNVEDQYWGIALEQYKDLSETVVADNWTVGDRIGNLDKLDSDYFLQNTAFKVVEVKEVPANDDRTHFYWDIYLKPCAPEAANEAKEKVIGLDNYVTLNQDGNRVQLSIEQDDKHDYYYCVMYDNNIYSWDLTANYMTKEHVGKDVSKNFTVDCSKLAKYKEPVTIELPKEDSLVCVYSVLKGTNMESSLHGMYLQAFSYFAVDKDVWVPCTQDTIADYNLPVNDVIGNEEAISGLLDRHGSTITENGEGVYIVGKVIEDNVETKKDGSSVETSKETKADGSVVESKKETSTDGVVKEASVETKVDGSKVESTKEVFTNGSSVETSKETKADGSTTEIFKRTDANGDSNSVIVDTNIDTKDVLKVTKSESSTGEVTKAAATLVTSDTVISKDVANKANTFAGTDSIKLELEVRTDDGKLAFKVRVDTSALEANKTLYTYRYDSKTKKYNLVESSMQKVKTDANANIECDFEDLKSTQRYEIVTKEKATEFNNKILATVKPKVYNKTIKDNKSTTFAMSNSLNMENVKSIKYTSSNKNVATINKNGKVVAKNEGKTKVSATVTLLNGKKKTVKMNITVS